MIRSLLLFALVMSFNSLSVANIKVGLVLDKGGKDDKSFNSAAYEGAQKAVSDLKIDLKYVEATDINALENLHRQFAQKKYDLIIGIGFAQTEAVKKIAAQFPQTHFALVDGELNLPNVRSLLFEEHQGSFLVGAIAALKSKSNKIGFVGGMDIPLIRRFSVGYAAGIKYIKPKAQLIENYVGVTGEAWTNPAKAKALALSQISSGVEIIFVAAGASGSGVFDAVEEKKKLAIGVDSNQNWMRPGFILTSMLKRVDLAVYKVIEDSVKNKFTGGVVRNGLADKGIDYALDQYNEKLLTADIRTQIEDIKKKIISGQIQVPDYYKMPKK